MKITWKLKTKTPPREWAIWKTIRSLRRPSHLKPVSEYANDITRQSESAQERAARLRKDMNFNVLVWRGLY